MQTTGDNESGEPMIDMNVTPLIDVMLVLLIMFIITIPIQTHAVKLDLPTCSTCPVPKAKSNELAVTRSGAIRAQARTVSRVSRDTHSTRSAASTARRRKPPIDGHASTP